MSNYWQDPLDWHGVVTEITFDYEPQYKPRMDDLLCTVYKSTFYADGRYERKGHWGTYDKALFPRIKQLVKLMMGEEWDLK